MKLDKVCFLGINTVDGGLWLIVGSLRTTQAL